ncbi:PF20097 family protein [Sphingomonas sp.]|uniref:PF20097 family protein n=1 Tax=Sphingomonas sp. TaxID=28214 RepID=UPI00286CBF96|nr:PF20097 family protein [Sphingomonas sp.]
MSEPTRSLNCPRCSSAMEPGYIIDVAYGTRAVPKWVAGLPQKSIWTGLKVRGLDQIDVATYRCRRCGYLESYASG